MSTQDTPVDEGLQLDHGQEAEDDWLEESDELPRRPRRRLLAPIPLALLVVLLIAGAFFAGVQVEKGQSPSSMSGGFPTGLAALRGTSGGSSGSSRTPPSGAGAAFPGGGGFPGAAGLSGGLTTGEVSYVSSGTLYVNSGENTVKVNAPAGTKVSKTVSTSVHSIHPGDTVVVRGSQSSNGSVTASSISIGSAGAGNGIGSARGSSGAGATQQLFGTG